MSSNSQQSEAAAAAVDGHLLPGEAGNREGGGAPSSSSSSSSSSSVWLHAEASGPPSRQHAGFVMVKRVKCTEARRGQNVFPKSDLNDFLSCVHDV